MYKQSYVIKRLYLRRVLKVSSEFEHRMCLGSEFQNWGAEKENDCSPIFRGKLGLISNVLSLADLKFLRGVYTSNRSFRYKGQSVFRVL